MRDELEELLALLRLLAQKNPAAFRVFVARKFSASRAVGKMSTK